VKSRTYIRTSDTIIDDAQTAKSDVANYRASPLFAPTAAQPKTVGEVLFAEK
jgi:hypothetical protein